MEKKKSQRFPLTLMPETFELAWKEDAWMKTVQVEIKMIEKRSNVGVSRTTYRQRSHRS